MLAARKGLLAVALLATASVAIACSADPDSAKKPLPVCDAKDPDCPGVPPSSASKTPKSDNSADPVEVPTTGTTPLEPEPSTLPDASVDAAPVLGKDCQGLAACCKQLGDAGYDTTRCKSVLSTNNEDACYTQHASYKSFGDCS